MRRPPAAPTFGSAGMSSRISPPPSRARRTQGLADSTFDLLVIGGGVTGAATARDAALRGMRVALVEKDDFGSGTSSRSSRLIHGGLRYLEHGHLHLVFEASRERRLLLRLAPHLVRPLGFVWPVYQGARVPRWKLAAGLTLYDGLALFRNVRAHERLSRPQVLAHEPRLRAEGLQGGARYFDAATDDARLTLANVLGASEAGAVVMNHAAVRALCFDGGRVCGATVVDGPTGSELSVFARAVVNATGPWSDEIRRLDRNDAAPVVRGSKGVHIAVRRERIGNREALTLLSPVDGRVYFVIPAGPLAIVGTTETATRAHPDEVRATQADVQYLLDSANAFFPGARLAREDVVSAWAGIRPLAASAYQGRGGANSASREHVVSRSHSGVIGISGGKLTTFRVMAADVVDAVERELRLGHRRPATAKLPLPGGDLGPLAVERSAALEALGSGGTLAQADHLVGAYGSRWREVAELWRERPELSRPVDGELPYLAAEAVHAARFELAQTLGDVLVRRTKLAFQTADHGAAAALAIGEALARELGWSGEQLEAQLRDYSREAERIFHVDAAEEPASANQRPPAQRAAS